MASAAAAAAGGRWDVHKRVKSVAATADERWGLHKRDPAERWDVRKKLAERNELEEEEEEWWWEFDEPP